ncbi:fibronectin type III domain-containing protein [Deinococcus sp.]|uniref:fibronectin type III domain-containing protein n=1 Tax=Deinococcus sp. TaxID=47478 RepID=UPI003C7C70B6
MRTPLISLATLTLGVTFAQTQTAQNTSTPARPVPAKTGLATLPTPTGALLRWALPGAGLPGGYRLIREGGGQSVSRDLPPLADKATAVKAGWISADDYDALKALLGKPKLAPGQALAVQLQVLADPGLARTLNLLTEDAGLKAGVSYSYRVQALKGGSVSDLGRGTVTPGPTPPVPVPGPLSGKASLGRADLAWTAAGGLTVGYRVYRAEGDAALTLQQPSPYFPTTSPKNPAAPVSLADERLTRKATYRYQVSALDLFGREGARTAVLSVDLRNGEPLPPALITRAIGVKGTLELGWVPATDPRVGGYLLYRGLTPSDLKPLTTLPATASAYTDRSGEVARSYLYALGYVLKPGTDAPGEPGRPGPPTQGRAINAVAPAAPQGLSATLPPDGSTDGKLHLTWKANPESDLLGYLVLSAATPESPLGEMAQLTPQPITGTVINLPLRAAAGSNLYYRVQAVNTSGVASVPSAPVSVRLPESGSDAPVLGRLSAGDGRLTLGWSYRASAPASVEVFRQSPNGALTLVAHLPGSALEWSDTHVIPLLPYAYLVTTLNAAGKRSAASNVMSGTPRYLANVGSVSGLSVTSVTGGRPVELAWKPAPEAAAYQVFRTVNGTPLLLATVATLEYRDTPPAGTGGASYRIVPIGLDGMSGEGADVDWRP